MSHFCTKLSSALNAVFATVKHVMHHRELQVSSAEQSKIGPEKEHFSDRLSDCATMTNRGSLARPSMSVIYYAVRIFQMALCSQDIYLRSTGTSSLPVVFLDTFGLKLASEQPGHCTRKRLRNARPFDRTTSILSAFHGRLCIPTNVVT